MPVECELILTDPEAIKRYYAHAERVGVDIETTGLNYPRARVMVLSIAAEGLPPAVLHLRDQKVPEPILDLLSRATLIGHNITCFDLPFLKLLGVRPQAPWYDTMILEQLASTGRRSLSVSLANSLYRRLGVQIDKSLGRSDSWTSLLLTPEQIAYAANDVRWLTQLAESQLAIIREHKLDDSLDLELRCQVATYHMRVNGVPINLKALRQLMHETRQKQSECGARLRQFGLSNPSSPAQVLSKCRELGIQVGSTDHEVLTRVHRLYPDGSLKAQFLDDVLQYRAYTRQLMYDDDWVSHHVTDGRIYPTYRQLGTDTGRFSASEPNIQQWIVGMRKVVQAPEGRNIVYADYRQLEVVIACAWYKDERLLDLVRSGGDLHRQVAALVWDKDAESITPDERESAKKVVWTYLFAGGKHGMEAGLDSDPSATMRIETVRSQLIRLFPEVVKQQNAVKRRLDWYIKQGMPMIVRPKLGPRREIYPDELRPSRVINTLVQGTAASGLKRVLARLVDEGLGDYLVTCLHDEVVLECPESETDEVANTLEAVMREEMEDHLGLAVDVEVKQGKSWGN